jgi:hypothetical protein
MIAEPFNVLPRAIAMAIATGLSALVGVVAGTLGNETVAEVAVGGAVVCGLFAVALFVARWIIGRPKVAQDQH